MIRLSLAVVCSFVFITAVSAADKNQDPPEVTVLKKFVGVWDIAVTNTPTGGDRRTYKVVSRRTWDDVSNTVRAEDEQPNNRPPMRWSIRHDANVGNYALTIDGAEPNLQIMGTWNDKTKTMEFTGTLPNAGDITLNHKFPAKDKAIVSAEVKDGDGTVIGKMVFHQVRRREGN